jgi:hypothetical protein
VPCKSHAVDPHCFHCSCRVHPRAPPDAMAGVVPAHCVIGVLVWLAKMILLHPNERSCIIPDETPNILFPLLHSFAHRASKRRVLLLRSFSRFIPQFALYPLSLGIGATIARLSPDRGIALVEEAHPRTSRSSSTAQRGAGDNYTSYLEMQLAASFC